ncbi:hypothetical protein [Achromobacter sp.]|uniref:hypothetical protein n=1 Tax=Achromobacter sp. TaxID=134375 RepID=UPI0031D0E959
MDASLLRNIQMHVLQDLEREFVTREALPGLASDARNAASTNTPPIQKRSGRKFGRSDSFMTAD